MRQSNKNQPLATLRRGCVGLREPPRGVRSPSPPLVEGPGTALRVGLNLILKLDLPMKPCPALPGGDGVDGHLVWGKVWFVWFMGESVFPDKYSTVGSPTNMSSAVALLAVAMLASWRPKRQTLSSKPSILAMREGKRLNPRLQIRNQNPTGQNHKRRTPWKP